MDASTVINLRLNNQLLMGSDLKTPQDVVSWMGAVQAQDFNMSKWALGVRLPLLNDKSVEDAVNKGQIIRTHILRPTWHLVAAQDIHWMLELSRPRLRPVSRSYNTAVGLTDLVSAKAHDIIRQTLESGKHLTRSQIGDVLNDKGIELNSHQLNQIMFGAELEGIVCNGAIAGNKQTYCLLEERILKTEIFDKETALERLARKYFTSHAPATLNDFFWWSGLTMSDARRAMEMIKPDFVVEKIDSLEYWINNSFAELQSSHESVFLLPAWDEFIVSYKNRQHIVSDEHYQKVISKNGIFKPIVVKDGQIIGIWKRVKKKDRVSAEIELFSDVDSTTAKLIKKASDSFDRFHSAL